MVMEHIISFSIGHVVIFILDVHTKKMSLMDQGSQQPQQQQQQQQQPQQGTSNGQVLPTCSQTLQAFAFRRLGPLVALPAGSHGRGLRWSFFCFVKKCSETFFFGMKF